MILQIRNDCGHSGFAFSREGVVVPSVCFTPWSGVRIPLTTAPASLPCFRRWQRSAQLQFPYGLHKTATTLDIPSRWDRRANQSPTGALVAVLRTAALFDSRMGQIKNALAQCAKTATTLDVPSRWDPNTKKEPTGLFFAACGRPCSFDSSYGLHEKIPDPKIRDFIHDPYGNRTHVTAVKGPCLNRLTNGP